jgi:carbon starvation protein
MNSPAGLIGTTVQQASTVISSWGFVVTPEMLSQIAKDVGENTVLSRTGGAPTLAVGMAHILSGLFGGKAAMAVWYHFAILFEALFILTTVDAGTRVLRFMLQDMIGSVVPSFRETKSWANNLIGSGLAVVLWGYFLYQGVVDPLGGINTLWPLFGASNQMLAGMALIMCTVVLFKMKRERYAWVTILPMVWLLTCTLTAGLQKIFHPKPSIGFLAHAQVFGDALAQGKVLAPAKSLADMSRIVTNDYVNATMAAAFVAVVLCMIVFGIVSIRRAVGNPKITATEIGGSAAASARAAGA